MNDATKIYEAIVDRLNAMKLSQMALEFDKVFSSPDFLTTDRLEIIYSIVSAEYERSASAKYSRRLRKCRLIGSPEDISKCADSPDRRYSPTGIVQQLSSFAFIKKGYNLLILGASGAGKSYLAKALAITACAEFRGEYQHCSELAESLSELRRNDYAAYEKRRKGLAKLDFLVIDDFLISPLSDDEANVLFSILERRCESMKSTIICSQRDPKGWGDMLSDDQVMTDAITKRVTKNYVAQVTKNLSE